MLTATALTPLFDVVCRVEVILGTASMSVRDCLTLQRRSVIRLSEPAGADMRVLVNGVAIANGQVVVVEDSTSIRVTDILAPPSSEVGE